MSGKLTGVAGTMEVQKFGQAGWTQAKEGMEIGPGDQIAAGIDGKARLIYPNSQTDIEPLAQMAVGKSEESDNQFRTDLFLQLGNIKSHVEKQGKVSAKSNRFTVTTPSSVCGIRGTTLDVGYSPGIGTVASIPEGAGYAQQINAEQLPPEVQRLLNVGPAAEAPAGPAGAGPAEGAVPVAPAAGGEAGEQPIPTEIVSMDLGGAPGEGPAARFLGEAVDLSPGVGQAAFADAARAPDMVSPMVIPPDAPMLPSQMIAMAAEAFNVPPSVLMAAMQQAHVPQPVFGGPPPGAGGGGVFAAAGGPGGVFMPVAFIDPLTNPDRNADGIPDFRAVEFGLVNFSLTGDDDGDGWTNEQEFKGGSNPKDRNSRPGAQSFGAVGIAYNGIIGQFAGFGGATGDANGDGITNQFAFDAGLMLNVSFGDVDRDGIPDDWELANGLNPNLATDANSDLDGDGRTNRDEFFFHTNPRVADAAAATTFTGDRDNDGMPNEWEVFNGLNPDQSSDGSADADGDGFTNSAEFFGGSNPRDAVSTPGAPPTPPASQDADLDGIPNDWEINNGLNPNLATDASADADGDGFSNIQEFQGFSNPRDANSRPFSGGGGSGDNDADMSFNQEEVLVGTNQTAATQRPYYLGPGSGLTYEASIGHTHNNAPGMDGDMDGMPDAWEAAHGLNAAMNDANANPDADGFTNLQEFQRGGDPQKNNSSLPTQTDVGSLSTVRRYEFRGPNSDKLIGAHYDEYMGGNIGPSFRVWYMPDRADAGDGYSIGTWARTSGVAGMGYVNVGASNLGSDASTRPTIVDGDGDGHSPISAFVGTVFYDPNDANYGLPVAQMPGALPNDKNSWQGNPNPFHH